MKILISLLIKKISIINKQEHNAPKQNAPIQNNPSQQKFYKISCSKQKKCDLSEACLEFYSSWADFFWGGEEISSGAETYLCPLI